jgi:branched-chain amino acid transport system substrate-binding protein
VKRTIFRLGTLLVALALVAAACGDDDDDDGGAADTTGAAATTTAAGGSGTATSAAGGSGTDTTVSGGTAADLKGPAGTGKTRGVTDAEVKLGCVVTAQFYPGFEDGIEARLQRANEAKVNGRSIILEGGCQDDGTDPTANQTAVRSLVQQDEVFGVINNSTGLQPATSDFMTENEVPYVGWGTVPGYCGHRWGFGFSGCLSGSGFPDLVPHPYDNGSLVDPAIELTGLEASAVKMAVIGNDNDASRAGNQQFENLFKARGAQVVYNENGVPAATTVDYTPFIQALMAADPNIVILDLLFDGVGPLTGGLRAAGFEGIIMNFVAYQPGLLEQSPDLAESLEGAIINSQTEPQETGSEYITQMQADLTASGAADGTTIKLGTALGYEMANLFVQMIEAAGPELDTKTFDEAVNGGGFTFQPGHPDGAGDLAYPDGHFLPAPCAAMLKVEGGKYTVALPFQCYGLIPAGG